MPRIALKEDAQGNRILAVEGLIQRIDRHLHTLIPYREIRYDYKRKDYYVGVVSPDPAEHRLQGPYYHIHMVSLARMINALTKTERKCSSIIVQNRNGDQFLEQPLPIELQFTVITPALADMAEQLRKAGIKVPRLGEPLAGPIVKRTYPSVNIVTPPVVIDHATGLVILPAVTAPVIQKAHPIQPPDEDIYEDELTEEMEALLRGPNVAAAPKN